MACGCWTRGASGNKTYNDQKGNSPAELQEMPKSDEFEPIRTSGSAAKSV